MKCAFLLHLYQPFFQEKTIFDKIYSQSYKPLLELIKEKQDITLTLNVPLSLLELMEKFGYSSWIEDLKKLYISDRVELVGSGAYHPLLTFLPDSIASDSVILNEYGIGYYLGNHTGFDGDPCILLKNITGFFPPELAVNMQVLKLLSSLGYDWCLVDTPALDNNHSFGNVFRLDSMPIKIIVRNTQLSNAVAFKRNAEINDLITLHSDANVIALDGETFGFHNPLGIILLNNLLQYYSQKNIQVCTISNFVNSITTSNISGIKESSWGMTKYAGEIYPNWINKSCTINTYLWEFYNKLVSLYQSYNKAITIDPNTIISLWNATGDDKLFDNISIQRMFNSDMFWWSSKIYLPHSTYLFDKNILRNVISIYRYLLNSMVQRSEIIELLSYLDKIQEELFSV